MMTPDSSSRNDASDMPGNTPMRQPRTPAGSGRTAPAGRLRNETSIGAVAARQRRQRAVAGALLLGHRLHVDVGGGPKVETAQRIEREHHRRDAGLHVVGAAT